MLLCGVLLGLGGCFNPTGGGGETDATPSTSADTGGSMTGAGGSTSGAPTTGGPGDGSTGAAATATTDPTSETGSPGDTTAGTTGGGVVAFMPAIEVTVPGALGVITARLDDDGRDDLVALSSTESGGLYRILGAGLGGPAVSFATSAGTSLAGAPFNGDPFTDVVLAATDPSAIEVVRTEVDGSFASVTPMALMPCTKPVGIALGDADGDLNLDVAVACDGEFRYYYAAGTDGGNFAVPAQRPLNAPALQLAFADMVGDERVDLVVVNSSGLDVLPGAGGGLFDKENQVSAQVVAPTMVAVGFVDDPFTDLVVAGGDGTCSVFYGTGDTTLGAAYEVACGTSAAFVAIGDLSGDGAPELAAVDSGEQGALVIAVNNGDGTFTESQEFAAPIGPRALAIGDYDGVFGLDVAVAGEVGTVSVFLSAE